MTMNDRGLSLTSTEMLKGYLLSEIKDDTKREKAQRYMEGQGPCLKKDDDKGDETFIKAWLRAQYAETIQETKAGAVNQILISSVALSINGCAMSVINWAFLLRMTLSCLS